MDTNKTAAGEAMMIPHIDWRAWAQEEIHRLRCRNIFEKARQWGHSMQWYDRARRQLLRDIVFKHDFNQMILRGFKDGPMHREMSAEECH